MQGLSNTKSLRTYLHDVVQECESLVALRARQSSKLRIGADSMAVKPAEKVIRDITMIIELYSKGTLTQNTQPWPTLSMRSK